MRCLRPLLLPSIILLMAASSTGAQPKKADPVNVSDAELIAWLASTVKERMPQPEERTFDQIGWTEDIRDALSLAKKHNRPVFLFTHDGRMNLGRC